VSKFTIEAEATKETPKAIYVETEQGNAWIPLSMIDDDSEVYALEHKGKLVIPDWLADEKGWE